MTQMPEAVVRPKKGASGPHAIVIGSGFGGLAAAIRLGARGYRVSILEKLDAPIPAYVREVPPTFLAGLERAKAAELAAELAQQEEAKKERERRIAAKKAGLDIPTADLESHYLAGGRVTNVVRAMIAADKARIDLGWERATAIDLAGRDIVDAVRTSVDPKVIDCPSGTSQKATRFSLRTSAMLAAPRPAAPMMPMLSFSLGERHCPRLPLPATQMAAPAQAEFFRKRRRSRSCFIGELLICPWCW